MIISGSRDTTVKLWNAKTGKIIHTLEGHTDFVTSVAWSCDGKMIISGSGDTTVKIWDVKTGKIIHTLHKHIKYITSVAWSHSD